MTTNPDPAHIPDALWYFWEKIAAIIPGVRLGGIYANKRGYHNTVKANQATWPGDYSIRFAIDRQAPLDKARAIDLTMGDVEMKKRTALLVAAVKANDPRMCWLREFIGTVDGTHVTCYIHDDPDGPWRFDGTRDTSHLWHIHLSWFTPFCDDTEVMDEILSVLSGQTLADWEASKEGSGNMLCKYKDKSDIVASLQEMLLQLDPTCLPQFGADGGYGDETAAALVKLKLVGKDTTGKTYGSKEYAKLHAAVAKKFGGTAAGVPAHAHTLAFPVEIQVTGEGSGTITTQTSGIVP